MSVLFLRMVKLLLCKSILLILDLSLNYAAHLALHQVAIDRAVPAQIRALYES